ncbi:hypothetical protein Ciccas_010491 [Cichlidogyrus casuarinus]|uniref:Uncharacterized protein n=1 Tax=Cichlidogyrus casuarinus TaxID=1844966 RepID=A0ABD2PTZ1_9PLAT
MRHLLTVCLISIVAIKIFASPGSGDAKRKISALENLKFSSNIRRPQPEPAVRQESPCEDRCPCAENIVTMDQEELDKLKENSSRLDMLKNFFLFMKLRDRFSKERKSSPDRSSSIPENSNSLQVQPAYYHTNRPPCYSLGPPTGAWNNPYGPQMGCPPPGIGGPGNPMYGNYNAAPFGSHWHPNQYPCMPGGISGVGPEEAPRPNPPVPGPASPGCYCPYMPPQCGFPCGPYMPPPGPQPPVPMPSSQRGIRGYGSEQITPSCQMALQQQSHTAPNRGQPRRSDAGSEHRRSSGKFMDTMSNILFNNGTEKELMVGDSAETTNHRKNSVTQQILSLFGKAVYSITYDRPMTMKSLSAVNDPLEFVWTQLKQSSLFFLLWNRVTLA